MKKSSALIDKIATHTGYRSQKRYVTRCQFVFDQIHLQDKRVLDVGCGVGAMAFWAALNGAASVLGIEPDTDGSSGGKFAAFQQIITETGMSDVVHGRPVFLQDLTDERFDVAILYNVINHIDEDSVQRLHHDPAAVQNFVAVLQHLRGLMTDGGRVIVADSGRRNFWNDIGVRNPIARSIQWRKHQQPAVWIPIFEMSGFTVRSLRWSPSYPFIRWTANALVQYFLVSHFVLHFEAT